MVALGAGVAAAPVDAVAPVAAEAGGADSSAFFSELEDEEEHAPSSRMPAKSGMTAFR